MTPKQAYLNSIRNRITCDSDGEREWDAYRGSALLLRAIWDMYERKGRQLRVAPEVAGMMLESGCSVLTAKGAIRG